MVKNSAPIPPPQFASPREHKGVPMGEVVDPVKLFAEYRQGATIIMDEVHRTWPPLARCREQSPGRRRPGPDGRFHKV